MIFELSSLKLDAIMHLSGIHHRSKIWDFNGIHYYFDSICNYFSMFKKEEIPAVINKYDSHKDQILLWNASIQSNNWTFNEVMRIIKENGHKACLYHHAIDSGKFSGSEMLVMLNDRLEQQIEFSEHDNIRIAVRIIKTGKLSGEELNELLGTPGEAPMEMIEAAKPFLTEYIESEKLSD